MVQKKRKSKRQNTSERAKISKKIREHNRKAKREGVKKKSALIAKGFKAKPKLISIPKNMPFEALVRRDIDDAKAAKALEKAANKRKASSLAELVQSAQDRHVAFDAKKLDINDTNDSSNLTPDPSRRFFIEFAKVLEQSNVILYVLDARNPLSMRDTEIERRILESGIGKKLVFVLNKVDLVPEENAKNWVRYLNEEFPTVSLCRKSKHTVEALLSLLKSFVNVSMPSLTVGVIGYPNTGKSSLINALVNYRSGNSSQGGAACATGGTPGITKNLQLVKLDKHLKLLDSPGIVFQPNDSSKSNNCMLLNCSKIDDPELIAEELYEKLGADPFMNVYGLPSFSSSDELLGLLAKKYGKLKSSGIVDLLAAAHILLNDWNIGKIPYFSIVPDRNHSQLEASLHSTLAPEFSLKPNNSKMMLD